MAEYKPSSITVTIGPPWSPSKPSAPRRSTGDKLWRGFLWFGLILSSSLLVVDTIRADWSWAWHDVCFTGAFFYVLQLERTLDRWEPFVPPSYRRRP